MKTGWVKAKRTNTFKICKASTNNANIPACTRKYN